VGGGGGVGGGGVLWKRVVVLPSLGMFCLGEFEKGQEKCSHKKEGEV